MDCPNSHGPMIAGRKSWVCEECDCRVPRESRAAPAVSPTVEQLPSVLAIPLSEYLAESHPVMRLHRLCDAAEILVRFLAVVALGEVRRALGAEPLPDQLLKALQPSIERPTFGQWRDMLAALTEALAGRPDLVVPELPPLVTADL
ncbi:MAG: hypothetical protein FJX74_12545, partial [Armatimonadetes bacterium]|nr:hypothetical protein [Armatimonadota bacterium]